MNIQLNQTLCALPKPYVTDFELAHLLGGTPNSRYSKVKRLSANGTLVPIKKGLYVLGETVGHIAKPHPFELAQRISFPSYISLESALSYHQLIPEAVYVTTSVHAKRVKEFDTPLGKFSYDTLPSAYFYLGVERVDKNGYQFFIASPWKAIFDYIYVYKKNYKTLNDYLASLRIERKDLPIITNDQIERFKNYYHRSRLTKILDTLKQE